jgi:hypothetical protein
MPRPAYHDQWEGHYVAVIDDAVVAASESSVGLSRKLLALGLAGEAMTEYVPAKDEPIAILGWE